MGGVVRTGFTIFPALVFALVFTGCDFRSTGVQSKSTSSQASIDSPSPSPTPILAPATLVYTSNPASYKVATLIPANIPAVTGGAPTSYTVTPALPTGLRLDAGTGVITGTPTTTTAASHYFVTATNSAGSAQADLGITIVTNAVPPTNLTYSNLAPVFARGILITPLMPTSQGGAPTTYAISSPLPNGLLFNTATGVISGTPTAISAAAPFTVTATNEAGSATVMLSIAVKELAPATVAYSLNPAAYKIGGLITPNTPVTTGGLATAYAISAPLPTGLLFNTTTGVITGTPTVVSAITAYTVTASNAGGSAMVSLAISVNDIAPATLAYSVPQTVYPKGVAISANLPASTGGTITDYSVLPALPTGLVLGATSGSITGTPTTPTLPTAYVVTGKNAVGAVTATLTLGVSDLGDPNANYTYLQTNLLTPKCNSCHGAGSGVGDFTTWATLKAASVVVGNPLASALYIRTAPGAASPMPPGGTITTVQSFAILNWIALGAPNITPSPTPVPSPSPSPTLAPPATVTYSSNPASYKVATLITANTPTVTGGAPTAYTVLPALPAGLSLNPATGVITGTPTTVTGAANYTVTATNAAGSASVALNITVVTNVVAPTNLTYANLAPKFVKGTLITALVPTSQGGSPASFAISATLPAGLAFSTTTGAISGTPTVVSVMTPYTVTATNAGGSATVTLAITVNDIAPAGLTYSAPKIVYPKGAAIAANISLSTGGVITAYSISPALPAGLSLNPTMGTITGTPTTPLLPAVFTVTGTNTGGSITAPLTFGVSDPGDVNATYTYLQTSLLTPNCNSCHGAGSGAGDFTAYASLAAASVVAGNPLTSALFIRTAPGAASPMPPGGTITTVQSFAIMNWIALGAPSGMVAPSPTPSPTAAAAGTTYLAGNDDRLRIGNRTYIASVLQDIFGTSATAPVGQLISAPIFADVLGGPCNDYSGFNLPVDYGQITLGSDCASVASAQVAAIPVSTTARGALMTRTCDLILSQDASVLNAASLAAGTSYTTTTLPAMTATSVAQAYDLFYYGRPIDATVATNLLAIASAGETSLESWRFTLLALCYAPDWQIP